MHGSARPFDPYPLMDTAEGRRMRRLRRLSDVPRWSIAPMLREQNVAEHSFQVLNIAQWLMEYHPRGDDMAFRCCVMEKALNHEEEEAITGDMPSMTKGDGLPKGDEGQAKVVVKCADLLEMAWWIREEEAMGNSRLLAILMDIKRKLEPWWALFEWGRETVLEKPSWQDLEALCTLQAWSDSYMHPAFEPRLPGEFDED